MSSSAKRGAVPSSPPRLQPGLHDNAFTSTLQVSGGLGLEQGSTHPHSQSNTCPSTTKLTIISTLNGRGQFETKDNQDKITIYKDSQSAPWLKLSFLPLSQEAEARFKAEKGKYWDN